MRQQETRRDVSLSQFPDRHRKFAFQCETVNYRHRFKRENETWNSELQLVDACDNYRLFKIINWHSLKRLMAAMKWAVGGKLIAYLSCLSDSSIFVALVAPDNALCKHETSICRPIGVRNGRQFPSDDGATREESKAESINNNSESAHSQGTRSTALIKNIF